jgi:hypothetical protein
MCETLPRNETALPSCQHTAPRGAIQLILIVTVIP